ncbi:MAG: sugar transferase [Planctomycetota bacterium]
MRRLFLAFLGLVTFCAVGAYIWAQPTDPTFILVHLIPVALAILLSLYVAELVGVTERPLPPLSVEALFWAIATSCIVMAVGYAVIPTYAPSTLLVCSAPVVAALAVFLQRKWLEVRGAREEAVPTALFADSRSEATRGMAELAAAPGVRVTAVLLPEEADERSPMAGLPVHTPDRDLAWFRKERIRLFLAFLGLVTFCAVGAYIWAQPTDLVAKTQGRVNLTPGDEVGLLSRLTLQANRFSAQRLVDMAIALPLVPLSLLIGLFAAIAIKLNSKGPVLFKQTRVGRWGEDFNILKFRTMRVDAEKETGPVWAQEKDPRATLIGGFLRKTRVDELPQLWNVLRGDMSLVGPRPERPFFVDTLGKKIPLYDARHCVRPGVTGWAQIRYNYGGSEEDARNKLGYELFFVLNRSLTFYFAVLLETLKVVLFQRGSR